MSDSTYKKVKEYLMQFRMKHMITLMNGWSGIRTMSRSSTTISYTTE